MSESASPEVPAQRSRRKKWRIFWACGFLALLLVVLVAGAFVFITWNSDRNLHEAIAEADRLDPDWRLEELDARRAVIPDEQNSALVALRLKTLFRNGWPYEHLHAVLNDLEPAEVLDAEQIRAVTLLLEDAEPALILGRKLIAMPNGRFPVTWSTDGISTVVNIQEARAAATLLRYDLLLRAQENDPNGALDSCRGVLNTARSVGDEPTMISQLVRVANGAIALRGVERVLAQGQPSAAALEACQRLIEEEADFPHLLVAFRGERAMGHRMMQALASGQIGVTQMVSLSQTGAPGGKASPALEVLSMNWFTQNSHTALIKLHTQFVEAAKLPPAEQADRFKQLQATFPDQPILVRLLGPAIEKGFQAFARSQAYLHSTAAALAAERFRLDRGRWPEKPADLVPAYSKAWPTDPWDGAPLRFRRLPDGLVIYSVGYDGKDDGGNLSRTNPLGPGADLGFRLWDPAKRRQPAKPRKPTLLELLQSEGGLPSNP